MSDRVLRAFGFAGLDSDDEYAAVMLAYVFWHRPRAGVVRAEYEDSLRRFHAALAIGSTSFRLDRLPFDRAGGYEDWYLVDDWEALGRLNEVAVDSRRRAAHDRAAGFAEEGWGGVYRLVRGEAVPPLAARWLTKPPEQPYEAFLEALTADAVWQRQLVLGPAPEFCAVEGATDGREAR